MSEFEKFHLEDHRKLSRSIEMLRKEISDLKEFKTTILSSAKASAVTMSLVVSIGINLITAVAWAYSKIG